MASNHYLLLPFYKHPIVDLLCHCSQLNHLLVTGQSLEFLRIPQYSFNLRQIKSFLVFIFENKNLLHHIRTNFVDIKYRSILIGKYIVSTSLRSPKSFTNPFTYCFRFVKFLFRAFHIVEFLFDNQCCIRSVYAHDYPYMNGISLEFAKKYSIPVYISNYPFSLTRFSISSTTDTRDLSLVPYKSISISDFSQATSFLHKLTLSSSSLSYMKGINYEHSLRDLDTENVYAVIFAHSFTDAQQQIKDLSFRSVYEWLLFTLKILQGKKLILKAHPAFFRKEQEAATIDYDKIVWNKVLKIVQNNPNIQVINWPLENSTLFSSLASSTVMITHHGTCLIEAASFGFKCICSFSSPSAKYPLFNTWSSKDEYARLLLDPSLLQKDNINVLLTYVYNLYLSDYSYDSASGWKSLFSNYYNINPSIITTHPSSLSHLDPSLDKKLVNLIASSITHISV